MECLTPVNIAIHIKPKACPRPRVSLMLGKPVAYMPKTYKDWQAACIMLLRAQYKGDALQDCSVRVKFNWPRPKAMRKQKSEYLPKCTKPDLDNCIKAILDACTSAGIVEDDRFIYAIDASQWYAPIGCIGSIELSFLPLKK